MGIPIAERDTPSGAASAKRGARGVAQHAAGGVETDLSANIPTHERPEEIAGQRSATSLRSCDTPSSSRGRWRGS
jgi:hypothetical protein